MKASFFLNEPFYPFVFFSLAFFCKPQNITDVVVHDRKTSSLVLIS